MHAYIEYDIGTTASLQRAFMWSGWTLLHGGRCPLERPSRPSVEKLLPEVYIFCRCVYVLVNACMYVCGGGSKWYSNPPATASSSCSACERIQYCHTPLPGENYGNTETWKMLDNWQTMSQVRSDQGIS